MYVGKCEKNKNVGIQSISNKKIKTSGFNQKLTKLLCRPILSLRKALGKWDIGFTVFWGGGYCNPTLESEGRNANEELKKCRKR